MITPARALIGLAKLMRDQRPRTYEDLFHGLSAKTPEDKRTVISAIRQMSRQGFVERRTVEGHTEWRAAR